MYIQVVFEQINLGLIIIVVIFVVLKLYLIYILNRKKVGIFFLEQSFFVMMSGMWIGYGFDVVEIVVVMVNFGFVYLNIIWMYVFYFYLVFVVIIGFILMVLFKLSEEIFDNKLYFCFVFFKLILVVMVGVIFFQFYF